MSDSTVGRIGPRALASAALAMATVLAGSQGAWAQAPTPSPSAAPEPVGRWVGAGIQVDWLGNPLEIPRIVVDFNGRGGGTIDYPSLGCSGVLTRLNATNTSVQYRETLTSGADKCPSGAAVSFHASGDRWVYNWAVGGDWLKSAALASQDLPAQPAAGPDGDWVRSGVLTGDPSHARVFGPRDPAATVTERIAHIEQGMLPAVLVAGEAIPPVTLADRMAALHVPGVSVAVIHKGQIDWTRGYGVSGPGGTPVTADTLFQAASISKPVTALVTMRLAQEKAIDLDIDVSAYLGGWKLPRDPNAADRLVTLRDLLTHTGGLTVHGFAGYSPGAPLPTIDQILNGQPPANSDEVRVDTTPGVLWRYSGGGYVVIRKALENVTGLPFAELARRTVLSPAGMTHSSFAQPLPVAAMANAAWPYGPDGQPLKEGAHVYPEVTPDGLWSTPTDLARLVLQVQASLDGRPNGALSPAAAREMLEPGGLANWGMGWGLGGAGDTRYFWHSGSNAGFKSMLFAYRNGEGVVVMTNSDAGERLAVELARTIAYEYGWPDFRPLETPAVPLAAGQLDRLVGHYRIGRYATLTITRHGGELFAETPDRPRFRIYPHSALDWFAIAPDGFTPDPDVQLAFKRDADGRIDVVLRKDGYDTLGSRLDDAALGRIEAALAAHVGAKVATPDSEAALRRYIAQLQNGDPDYDTLGPGAAYITRLVLLNFASGISKLGKLQKLEFNGVDASGADLFTATFEHGAAKAQILCGEDGRIEIVQLASSAFL